MDPDSVTPSDEALDLIGAIAMDRQAMELAKHRAALKAEMDHVEGAYKRVHASMTAPAIGDGAGIQKSLDELTKRVSDIEKLLLIHDSILKDKLGPNPK